MTLRCSALYKISGMERHLDRALNTNLKTVNFSSIDSTGSGKGSYVFKRRGKITKKKKKTLIDVASNYPLAK